MTNARVEKADLIGKLGEGWAIAQTTLGYERGGSALARVTRYAVAVPPARRRRRAGSSATAGRSSTTRSSRQKLGAHLGRARGAALRRAPHAVRLEKGEHPGAGGSLTKLSYSEFEKRFRSWPWRSSARTASSPTARREEFAPRDRHRGGRPRHVGLRVPLVARGHDLRRLVGDPEERHRRAHPRAAQGDAGGPRGSRRDELLVHRRPDAAQELRPRAFLDEHCKPAARAAMIVGRPARRQRRPVGARWPSSAGSACRFPRSTAAAGSAWSSWRSLLEEMGRAAYPGPVLRQRGARRARRSIARRQRRRRRSAGCPPSPRASARATVALLEDDARLGPRAATTARRDARGRRLGAVGREALRAVGARGRRRARARARRPRALSLFLVDPTAAGVTLDAHGRHGPRPTGWSRDAARRRARSPPTPCVGAPGGAGPAARRRCCGAPPSAPPPRCWARRAAAST